VAYVPLAEVGREFLFQVIAERASARRHHDHQPPAVFRVDAGDSERAVMQSGVGPHHRPAHILETGTEVVSLSPEHQQAKERRKKVRDEMSYGNAGAVESMESQKQVPPFPPSWKSRKNGGIPTFPQLPRLLIDASQGLTPWLKTATKRGWAK